MEERIGERVMTILRCHAIYLERTHERLDVLRMLAHKGTIRMGITVLGRHGEPGQRVCRDVLLDFILVSRRVGLWLRRTSPLALEPLDSESLS